MTINLFHWYKDTYSALLIVLISLLFADSIIDPSNKILHIKYVLFGLIFIVWIPKLLFEKIEVTKLFLFVLLFISIFMPFYGLSIGLINNFIHNSNIGSIVYFNSFFFFSLALIIVNERFELTKILNYSSLLLVLITIGFYSVLIVNPNLFGKIYEYFVIEKQAAVYGLRNYGGFTILQMFYKTSPLLVFPLSYYLYQLLIVQNKKNLILQIFILLSILITLFLSGTRANMISLLLIVIFYFSFYIYKKSKILFTILGSIYILISFYAIYKVGGLLLNIQEESNMVKFGHLKSYIEYFNNHIGEFIFGQGLGGSFYSSGINQLTNITELSYFELIRIWGFPITVIFLLVLMLPLYYEIKSKNISHLFIAYMAYLFIAGTNPLLLSSTGMIVLVYVFSEIVLKQTPTLGAQHQKHVDK